MNRANGLQLAGEIERAIGLDPQVTRTNVKVQVIDGRVVLTGVVDTVAQREAAGRAAERIAAQLGGATRVENSITVAGTGAREPTDLELEQELDRVLAAVPGLPTEAVGARVERGVAFLVGNVSSAGQIEAAMEAARRVPGLKDVVSQVDIVTGAPPDPADLVNRVTDALGWDTGVNHRPIQVEADPEGTVTLTGEAETDEERQRAEQIALGVTGVHHVVNRIRSRGR